MTFRTRRSGITAAVAVAASILLGMPARADEPQPAKEDTGAAESAAPAQPAGTPPEQVQVEGKLPYVPTSNTIATRLPVPLRLTPASVGTVGDHLLREQFDLILGDALRNVSGLNVHTLSDTLDTFAIRGFDSVTSALISTDGAPEPEGTFYHMYNVERVEVLKGPGGFLYGRDPMGGAVNIVRQQPQPGTFGRVGVTYGSFATSDATADFNTASKDGGLAFRVNGRWGQSDTYRDDKYNRNVAVNPALTWRLSDTSSLNFNYEYVDADYAPDAGIPIFNNEIADVPRTRSYQSPLDFSEQNINRGQVDYEKLLGSSWTLRNKAYYRTLSWESDGTLFFGVFPDPNNGFAPAVNRFLTQLDDRQEFLGNRFEAVLSAPTGKIEHKILMGVEVASYGDEFTIDAFTLPNIDLDDPVETATQPGFPLPGAALTGDSTAFVVAPFVMDQIKFTEEWQVLAGARWDAIDYEDDENTQLNREDGEFSPTLGVVFAPTARASYYVSYGSSFAPPSARVTDVREPERARQYEAGAKMSWLEGKLQGTLSVYRITRDNIAIPDINGFTQQQGDQRSQGVEVDLTADLAKGLRAFFSYAYNDSELTEFTEQVFIPVFSFEDRSGNAPAFAPRNIANAWVSKRFDNGLGFGGGPRWLSEQFIDEDNAFAIDGYVTWDAAIFYEWADWEWTVNMKNLFGKEYETQGFGGTSVLPAPKFAVYGGARYRF